jgi:hypothetical protein
MFAGRSIPHGNNGPVIRITPAKPAPIIGPLPIGPVPSNLGMIHTLFYQAGLYFVKKAFFMPSFKRIKIAPNLLMLK